MTIHAPSTDPGMRPAIRRVRPDRSTEARSWRTITIDIGMPNTIAATGRASGTISASTGTATTFMPKPIPPWMAAPRTTTTAIAAHPPIDTSIPASCERWNVPQAGRATPHLVRSGAAQSSSTIAAKARPQ